jgi:hypothetical protein
MSDFWSRKLAGVQPAAPAASYEAPPAGIPWWQQPTYATAGLATQPTPAPPGPLDVHPLTATAIPQRLAPSAHLHDTCPMCGSGNYGRGTSNSPLRCFDCNYGLDRAQHSTAGMSAMRTQDSASAPARAALGQLRGGFFPKTIIGRIE